MNFVSPSALTGKAAGQYFTPEHVSKSLVDWVVRSPTDLLLDPSCGDGAILCHHANSRGIELDLHAAWVARERVPSANIDNIEFFSWAASTDERFDCAAGNPPFVRYQHFKGITKNAALAICAAQDVKLSGLSSTWPAFLVATASLLKTGGRMAFVVPAEIGHAPYAKSLLDFLVRSFSYVQVIAVRDKLFPRLSEDCWLRGPSERDLLLKG
ncbi:N-6 DNA methylase [Neorhizobium sp. DAR64872/K0K18]|uniref:N-6 DNA methylase n=1 Tax=Neorhizobium sp. DAR64872/K0K18 TaxID=3421958 RepID=UPI003D29FAB9